jgi:hypothetical protein
MQSCPEDIIDSITRYVNDGCPTGGFLFAVLSNDLKGVFAQADYNNRTLLFEIVGYCYNEIPSRVWGSEEKVLAHLAVKAEERRRHSDAQATVD